MTPRPDHIVNKKFAPSALAPLFENGRSKVFTPKRFLLKTFGAFLVVVAVSIFVHIGIDIYGLFRPLDDRSVKIYHEERISKYLLMQRYVPHHFEGIIIGTSLSDNLDISVYNQAHRDRKFYNASMMGANISEVKKVAESAIKGGIKNVVFCVSPYQFKNTGGKQVELNQKLYYGAFGSWNLYETYVVALIRQFELMPHKFPKEHINGDGVNNFTERYRAEDVAERIHQVADVHRGNDFVLDSAAVSEFKALVNHLKEEGVKFVIYFHPVPDELYNAQREGYYKFERMVEGVVGDKARILDMNSKTYLPFTTTYSNYIDNGHLSPEGQRFVVSEVMEFFEHH